MICDCCKKKKGFFESFAAVKYKNEQLNLCVTCNDFAYKIRDAINANNIPEYNRLLIEWNKYEAKSSDLFNEWKKEFIRSLEENKLNKK